MTEKPQEPWQGPPMSVLSARLAPDPQGPLPTLDDLGLAAAKSAGFAWQEQRSYARWNDLAASLSGRADSNWVGEIHGMIGVIGEQVLVAAEAEIEKAIASKRLDALPLGMDAVRASLSRSLRFFAEGQANALIVAAHGLANLTLRTLALDPAFAVEHVKKAGVSKVDFAPGSEAKKAWVSLTETTCEVFAAAAAAYSPQMQALANELADAQADHSVSALVDLRNVQYHRWRGESTGVTGVNLHEPTVRQLLQQGVSVGISSEMLPAYTERQAVLDELVSTGREALDALVGRLDRFLIAWHAAFDAAVK
jgi:hypothetical protein